MEDSSSHPSSEEDLETRANIDFPRILGMSEFEKLFEYVTERIQGELRYSFEGFGNIATNFPTEKDQPRRRERYVKKLTGTITSRVNFPRNLQFSAKQDENYRDFARISGLRFEFIGQDFYEIPQEELTLMQKVKENIRKYFEYTED